jgi:hypothetical protein
MPHLKCPACETRMYSTDSRAEPIGDLCLVCGSPLVPVGDLDEIVRHREIETPGSTSHRGAAAAGQLIVDPVGEITVRRGLGPSRAPTTPAPREPFVASAAGRPTRGDAQRLFDLLTAADGRPVAFATLARAGVGSSAAVTCQLELVGAPVRGVYERGRPVGARLDIHTQRPPRQLATPPLPAGGVQRRAPALVERVFDDGHDRRAASLDERVAVRPRA